MNCEQVQARLDDLVGGYLDTAEARSVDRHLETCAACRASLEDLQELLQQAQRLSPGLAPVHDLWPGILERLESSEGTFSPRVSHHWLAWAAVLALAVLAIPLLLRQRAPEPTKQATPATEERVISDDVLLAKSELARSEDRVLLTRRDLVEAIELRRDFLGPETSKSVEDSLRVLDRAVAEIRLALEEDPYNRRLRLLLAAKYQHEVRLLQRVSRV
jgi:hypothetical protein